MVTKLTHVERERAIGMLQANVTQSVAVKHFRCHVRTIVRLNNHFQQTWTTSDSPRPGRRRVMTRRQVETSGRLICAMDFNWRQSQLGHTQGLIIHESALKL